VIRTVWLAVLCFSGVAAVVATNAGTSTPRPIVGDSPARTTVADTFSADTLTKADKLEIAYVGDPVAAEPIIPIMPVTIASDEIPRPRLDRMSAQKIAGPRPHARKPATASPDRRIKIRETKKSGKVEREKVAAELRTCRRPQGIAGLLRAFNLAPGCDS
jgi:hypothetical protein